MILPLFDYADFMVESASKSKIEKLEKLQEKALRYVENDQQNVMNIDVLDAKYHVSPLSMGYRDDAYNIMYRQSKLHIMS